MKKYVSIVIGSILIALAFNIFFIPYNLFPSGIIGLGAIFNNVYHINGAIFIALSNLLFLLIILPVSGKNEAYKYLLTSILVPLFIYLTRDFGDYIFLEDIEKLIVAVFGAIVCGYGYSLVYRVGASIGGFEVFQDLFISKSKVIPNLVELLIISLVLFLYGFEPAVYTGIIIFIIVYMSTKAKLGISSNKSFFIVTKKEDAIKDYLINDLKYDYTEFNARGGFTNRKSKIIMCVIDTSDYYKLKEGIAIIDPDAFISIIDNYETINKNVTLTAWQRESLQKH